MKKLIVAGLLALASMGSLAEQQTITLQIPSMNCVTCPITVKKALRNIDGVSEAEVIFDTKLALVTFDDKKTNIKVLTDATTNAGYPSTIKE